MKKSRNPSAANSSKPAKPVKAKAAAKINSTTPAAKAAKKMTPAANTSAKMPKEPAPAANLPAKRTKQTTAAPNTAAKKATPLANTTGKESFFAEVFRLVRMVPKGRVTSYGDIANAAEARITARMVGWAMHAAGTAKPPVPAHRVVNSSGVLSGRQAFPTPTLMQELLEQEGVTVRNDKVQNFAKLRWAPPAAKSKDMPVVKQAK